MKSLVLPLVAAATLVALARTASADETAEPMRYPPSSVRPKLILGGVVLGGLAYGGGLATSVAWPDAPGAPQLKIPVAGPWLALGKTGCATDNPDCSGVWVFFRAFFTVLDGVAQLGALGLVGEGIFMTTEADAPKKAYAPRKTEARLRILPVPIVTPTQTGFGFVGVF